MITAHLPLVMVSEAWEGVLGAMRPRLNQLANLLSDTLTLERILLHRGGIFIPNRA